MSLKGLIGAALALSIITVAMIDHMLLLHEPHNLRRQSWMLSSRNKIPPCTIVRGAKWTLCGGKFRCNNGMEIDPSLVNDGFCDCPGDDIDDEPGTSACSMTTTRGFWCDGDAFIPNSRVDDGIWLVIYF